MERVAELSDGNSRLFKRSIALYVYFPDVTGER